MKEVQIEKLDNLGRGICYIDNCITFVKNTLPGEIVDIKIVKETNKYKEAVVEKIKKKNSKRVLSPCPYSSKCGGCDLLHLSYEDTLKYKEEKVENLFKIYGGLEKNIQIVSSKNPFSYRNKITLKVKNNIYGYYEEESHSLIDIKNCLLAENAIKKVIEDLKYLYIKDGEVTIRSNNNEEILIWIKTEEEIFPDLTYLKKKHKIVGIVLNNTCIFGNSYLMETLSKKDFKVSYDSFFQINRYISEKLFNKVSQLIKESDIILDLYCGVGTLGIIASQAKKVYGIEIIENAVLNAIENAKINNCFQNVYFLGDVGKNLSKIKERIDTIIIDPPRRGLDKKAKEILSQIKASKIIYVSCNPMTLIRDINDLKTFYKIGEIEAYDMFPFTQHVECLCVLCLR